mgnify:FL=1
MKPNQANEDYINKKLIYCSLLLQEYAYIQLIDSPIIRGTIKHKLKTKLRFVKNQLVQMGNDARISRKAIQQSEDSAIENVALMAQLLSSSAIIPPCQCDFIEEEFLKICKRAVENFQNKQGEKVI